MSLVDRGEGGGSYYSTLWQIVQKYKYFSKADCVQFSGAGANEIMEGFGQMKGFPRVIGAVDGCHIQIKTPQDAYHPMSYLNRKKDYSVILQVCFKKTKNHLKLKMKYTFSQR